MSGDRRHVAAGAAVLWLPTLQAMLDGHVGAGAGVVRFGIGWGLAWAAVTMLHRLIHGYARSAAAGDPADPPAATEPRRRAEDATTPARADVG